MAKARTIFGSPRKTSVLPDSLWCYWNHCTPGSLGLKPLGFLPPHSAICTVPVLKLFALLSWNVSTDLHGSLPPLFLSLVRKPTFSLFRSWNLHTLPTPPCSACLRVYFLPHACQFTLPSGTIVLPFTSPHFIPWEEPVLSAFFFWLLGWT